MVEFIKKFEGKVKKTILDYGLISSRDNVLVACSGGKDSTVILHILKKLGYRVSAITINALIGNYSKANLDNLKKFCAEEEIKLHVISFRDEFGYSLCYLRSVLNSKGVKLKSCTICGVLRRYILNRESRKLGATKIVTGHNLDDEAQSVMMNFFRGNLEMSARLGPITGLVKDKRFVPRIKPLYFCSESEIVRYSKLLKFNVDYSECPCRKDSYRKTVLDQMDKMGSDVKLKVIKNYLKLLPKLKKGFKTSEKPDSCERCGEPAKDKICQACRIVGMLKPKTI